MSHSQHKTDPGAQGRPYMEEADIGSGEKTPAQIETEELIRQIPPLPPAGAPPASGGSKADSTPSAGRPPATP
ncbi:MAG: hypothetical protein ACJ8LG_20830 [Massilia sp.]